MRFALFVRSWRDESPHIPENLFSFFAGVFEDAEIQQKEKVVVKLF